MEKIRINNSRLLDWYFQNDQDKIEFAEGIIKELKRSKMSTTKTDTLLYCIGCIPPTAVLLEDRSKVVLNSDGMVCDETHHFAIVDNNKQKKDYFYTKKSEMKIYKIHHTDLTEFKEVTEEEFMEWTKGLGETALALLDANNFVETAFSTYYNFLPVPFKNRAVRYDSITIDGIDTSDYPDFSDSYITSAQWEDGTDLDESELEEFAEANTSIPNEKIFDDQLFL
jgi:hypothetical protein